MRPLAERFWEKVAVGDPGACWEWQAARLPRGYGHLSRGARGAGVVYSHRTAWELTHGPIPEGLVVRHTCDNPPCCNPAHLLLGTQADNMSDQVARGRSRKGERHHEGRLDELAVRAIRDSTESVPALARAYGVSRTTIRDVRARRTWSHI